jgi:hypothetical protein
MRFTLPSGIILQRNLETIHADKKNTSAINGFNTIASTKLFMLQ